MTVDPLIAAVVGLFSVLTGGIGTVWHALVSGKLVFGRELERVTEQADKAVQALEATQQRELESMRQSLSVMQESLTVTQGSLTLIKEELRQSISPHIPERRP